MPMSACISRTTRIRSPRWSGVGSGRRPGNAPSGCAFRERTRQPRDRSRYGVMTQPAPLPGSTTTEGARFRIASPSTFERTPSVYRWIAASSARIEPTSDHGATWNRLSKKMDSMASSSSRRISIPRESIALRPLNSLGLWEAVTTIAPLTWPDLATKYCAQGVGTRPRSITSQPADISPEDRGGDVRLVVHAHAFEEGRVRDRRPADATRLAEDHIGAQPAFHEAARAHVHGRPQGACRDIGVRRDLRAARRQEEALRVQVVRQRAGVGPPSVEAVRRQAFLNQPREDLPLERDRMARLDEIEHARLEHGPARVHQVARDLSLPRLFDEPDNANL